MTATAENAAANPNQNTTAIETRQPTAITSDLVSPAKLDKILDAMQRFEVFKEKVLAEDDYMVISGKKFIKKSGLMKYALACGLSLQCADERREIDEKTGVITYHFTYRAVAPNGQFAEAVGSATSNEKNYKLTEHNTRALAQTRACNRAVSNLVASGQVSAEEIDQEDSAPLRQDTGTGRSLTPAELDARRKAAAMGGLKS